MRITSPGHRNALGFLDSREFPIVVFAVVIPAGCCSQCPTCIRGAMLGVSAQAPCDSMLNLEPSPLSLNPAP